MGLKIHKIIGYGCFLDSMTNNICKIEHLKNNDGEFPSFLEDYDLEGFKYYCEINNIKDIHLRLLTESTFPNIFNYQPEFGDKNLILFIPPLATCENWFRRDDIIDYTEETNLSKQKTRYEILENGIYPFQNFYNLNNNQLLKYEEIFDFIDENQLKTNEYRMKFNDEYLISNIVSEVPEILKNYLIYKKVFDTTEEVQKYLKPMIYVYWA